MLTKHFFKHLSFLLFFLMSSMSWGQAPWSGNGVEEDPYLITSKADLKELATQVNSGNYSTNYFKQTSDITFTVGDGNWTPIGEFRKEFDGEYDGNNKTIENLKIYDLSTTLFHAGLFGHITTNASIKDLKFKNPSLILKKNTGSLTTGVLAGEAVFKFGAANNMKVSNITVESGTLSITATSGSCGGLIGIVRKGTIEKSSANINIETNGLSYTGGLIGFLVGQETLSFCFSKGSIKSNKGRVGGLVGWAADRNIEQCFSNVNVTVTGNGDSGGLVGVLSDSKITNSFSRGFVNAIVNSSSSHGSFFGNASDSNITNSFGVGSVNGTYNHVGGFGGKLTGTNTTEGGLYFDRESTSQNKGLGIEAGILNSQVISKTTSEMKLQSTFEGWDFENVWSINPDVNDGYPFLINTVLNPVLKITAAEKSINNTNPVTITFTMTKDVGDFVYSDVSLTGNGSLNTFTSVNSKTYTALYTAPADQTGTVTITVANNSFTAGGLNGYGDTLVLGYDTTSPEINTFTTSRNTLNTTQTTTIDVSLTQSSTTFVASDIALESSGAEVGALSAFTATNSTTYSLQYTPPTNFSGTVTLTIGAGSFENTESPAKSNTQTSTLALSVDTIAPSITTLSHTHEDFVVRDANTVPIFVTFTEPMSNSPKISIGSLISNASMTVSPSTNSQTWTYDWDVPAGNDGVYTATISATDLFGNAYAGSENLVFTIDNISPTISLTENNDNDILLKSESSQFTLSSNETVAGTPTMTIETTSGTTQANFTASGSSWTYTFTAPDSYTGVVSFTASLTDIAGNISTATKTFSVDTEVPELTQISSPNTNGKYTDNDANPVQSDTLSITVSFNEDVYVTGTPSLALNTTPVQSAFYAEGSGTQTLTFSYKVQEGVEAADLTVTDISVGSGASILDAAGNPANTGLTDLNTNSRNLSDLKDLEIRAKDPVLSAFTAATNNSSSNRAATDTDVITYNFSSNVPLLSSSVSMTLSGFSSQPSLTQTNTGNDYTLSFTVASGMPEGPVQFRFFATDTHSSTQVPQENPSANYTQAAFDQVITIDRTPPTISSTALSSPENSLTGPSVTANEPISNYTITGGADQALLNINATTGQLSFVSAPDFEAPTDSGANNVYEIEVEVTDLVGLTASQTIAVTVTDVSDTFGVELVATDAQSSEEGGTAIVAVRLFTQPTAEVQINLQSSDLTEGSLSNSSLLFTTTNWNVVQNVTITGVDDTAVDGDITYQLQVASVVSADSNYNNLAVSGINLVNVDNEIDTDGDGYFDYQDAFPTDPSEWTDTDADGIGNNADPDDDNDGFTDLTENECGNDPLNASDFPVDSDADGVIDCQDVDDDNDGIPDSQDNCPFVSNALQADADLDGLGDLCDPDDDNDGIIDVEDAFPLDPNEWLDTDGDGIGNNADEDDDNDGQSDVHENNCFSDPLDAASMALDTDADRIPDCVDSDDDNDGVTDTEDVFPLDPNEWLDTDANGIGNNADPDDDNDGFTDLDELECNSDPLDSGEKPSDIDGDGIADCLDPDKDGDNVLDIEDSFPTDPSEWSDADNDGLGDNFDIDDDNDGCLDPQDAFPLDPSECADADADGIGDNADPDDNNDGFDDDKVLASGVLTPNSSGMESTWKIVNIEQYPNSRVRVYNANALEVFNATNYKNDWQGTFKGSSQMLPSGSYYYVIDLNIGQKPMTGWLYITY